MAKRAAAIPPQRFGTAEEFGAACAFLGSVQAGYLMGQNALLDGGRIRGRSDARVLPRRARGRQ